MLIIIADEEMELSVNNVEEYILGIAESLGVPRSNIYLVSINNREMHPDKDLTYIRWIIQRMERTLCNTI